MSILLTLGIWALVFVLTYISVRLTLIHRDVAIYMHRFLRLSEADALSKGVFGTDKELYTDQKRTHVRETTGAGSTGDLKDDIPKTILE